MTDSGLSETEGRAVTALRGLLQAGDRYRHQVAQHFGLGWTEVQAIGHLLSADELGQSELAHRLHITSGAATALVDRLERNELAARHPHPQDRRQSIIRLTDKGLRLVEVSRGWTQHAFEGVPTSRLDEATDILTTLTDNLNRQAVELEPELGAVGGR